MLITEKSIAASIKTESKPANHSHKNTPTLTLPSHNNIKINKIRKHEIKPIFKISVQPAVNLTKPILNPVATVKESQTK
ncbi:hypothetical protein [Shewanella pneumatophori]|uniref:Uncharacterized protein n=1 Tax=Shewanella pneumatophori TaxID=314092 RepID=A0A9X1ZCC1_9GAMM|nr:hypothetical protein [Shewanella pneumatophori]MCL1137685.1 hypothetical protein [Shewanella pneumatophori]